MKYYLLFLVFISPFLVQAQIDTEFWFGAPDVTKGTLSEPRRDSTVYMVMSTFNQPAVVTISQPANLAFEPIVINIPANDVKTQNLGLFLSQIKTAPANTVLNTGLLIRSTAPITAYYEVRGSSNTDLWALKGKNSMGTKFYVPSQYEYQNNQTLGNKFYSPPPRSGFIIMATKNNTSVSITPTKDILGHTGGETFTVNLNRGQTYYCEALDGSPENHFGGTLVESTKDITITIKDDMVDVDPSNDGGADIIGDQLVAYQYLGTEHILIDGSLTNDSDRGVVCATEDNTEIFIDGDPTPVAILNAGEQYMFNPSGAASFVRSSAPVSLLQVTGASDQVAGAIIPPLGCTGSNQVGFVRGSSGTFYLNLTIRAGSEGQFELNGNPNLINASDFSPVPGTDGDYVFAQITFGVAEVPVNTANIVTNFSDELFHLGIINIRGAAANFGYFSAFSYLNIGKNFEVCLNDSLMLDAGPGKTAYLWSNGATTQTTMIYEPGIYSVEVYSGTDCFATDSIEVEYYQLPVDLGPNDTICENTSLTLTIDGYYNFLWQDGSTENYFEVTEPGTYYVDVSDYQGCALRDSIQIAMSPRPITPEVSGDTVYCEGETISLFMNDFDNAQYRYILPSGEMISGQNLSLENAIPAQSGMYYAFYIEDGCESFTDSIEVMVRPMPIFDLGEDISVCSDQDVTLDPQISGGTFEWQDGSTGTTFNPQESGTYYVTFTDGYNCSAIDTIEVEFRQIPENPVITGEISYCAGETIVLQTPTQTGAVYTWTYPNGDTVESGPELSIPNADLLMSGTYSLQVNLNNCLSEVDDIGLVVYPNPTFELQSDTTICNDTQIEISGPAGFESYSWTNEATTQIIQGGAGIYLLTVTDANGCVGSDQTEIFEQGPTANFTVLPSLNGRPTTIFSFEDNSSPGNFNLTTWFWDFGDGHIDLNQNATYGFDAIGNFPVTLTIQDELGCEDKFIEIVTTTADFKIPQGFSPNGDGINDRFEIPGLELLSGVNIQIFNRWGGIVFESNSYGPGNYWDGKDSPDGTYFYILKLPNAKPISGSVTIAR